MYIYILYIYMYIYIYVYRFATSRRISGAAAATQKWGDRSHPDEQRHAETPRPEIGQ